MPGQGLKLSVSAMRSGEDCLGDHADPLFGYIIAYLDRVNVGFAKLQMLDALNFSDCRLRLRAGIFFLGYFIFEVSSNVILHSGRALWIFRVLVAWGVVSGCTALVRTPWEFYTVRFLLGIAEAGFFPGMMIYSPIGFPRTAGPKLMALLMAGNPVSGIIGGPLSGYILHHFFQQRGCQGWQWLLCSKPCQPLF